MGTKYFALFFRMLSMGIIAALFLPCSIIAQQQPPGERTVLVEAVRPALSTAVMKPGLEVRYYTGYFQRDLRKLPNGKSVEYQSFIGKPITHLDHAFGRGEVFASGESQGVGMQMKGFLHFSQAGTYILQALSNDGISVQVDGKEALYDPMQHSDRLSNRAEVKVAQSGWYPLAIAYFQRKGTATLRLMWQEPGAQEMVPIPAAAYGHLPGS